MSDQFWWWVIGFNVLIMIIVVIHILEDPDL